MSIKMQTIIAQRQLYLSKAKLKASSRTSALLSGFAMVALVELDLVDKSGNPSVNSTVIIAFGVCTTLLVSVHLLALMMSTCILPYMEIPAVEVQACTQNGESLVIRMKWYIELSWFFSTVLGLLLFLLEICIVFWIKFVGPTNATAAYVTTALLMPVFAVFLWFTYTFYKRLTLHKYEITKSRLQDLENYCSRLNEFETIAIPVLHGDNDKNSMA